jgi:hypothetical protein
VLGPRHGVGGADGERAAAAGGRVVRLASLRAGPAPHLPPAQLDHNGEEEANVQEDNSLNELQNLDAIASERGAVLAFRVCEDSVDLEPVFLGISSGNTGEENEVALIAIDDQNGLSLGRYVVSMQRLEAALDRAEDVLDDDTEPAMVPADWDVTD